MDAERLRYMADQIARNFAVLGEDEAAAATADHIAKFWDPRMRAQLLDIDAEGLSVPAARAVRILAEAG